MQVAREMEHLPVMEARAGDSDAWNVLLARFRLPLYAYVFELVREEQTSLDIVQESFINAARYIRSLRRDEKFGSWLFNIAHQKCVHHWRKQPRLWISLDAEEKEIAGGDPGPRELLIRKEQEEECRQLLSQLPLPQRAVLLLHFIEDFSMEEIAGITGAQIGTVKSRLHYARKAFRKLLEEK
jgi:RNA polymerase sigma-70 factor (ECF subfamily)